MSTNPKFWSDEFEVYDDPDFVVSFEDSLDAPQDEEAPSDFEDRKLAPWQRIDRRQSERQLRVELEDWDDYLTAH